MAGKSLISFVSLLFAPLISLMAGLTYLTLGMGNAWGASFFIDNVAGFNAAVGGLSFAGTEDFESSTLAADSIVVVDDSLAPGAANGPFPTGTNPATVLTVQSNTLGGMPSVTSPRGTGGLATASAPYLGTPTDQVSNNTPFDSFDMLFGLVNTLAVSFTPLVFDANATDHAGEVQVRVFDTSNVLIGSLDNVAVASFVDPTTFIGVVAMAGENIGRINIFATSANDEFTGADDIDVYTAATVVVPLPAALPLFGTGLALLGFAGWRRKRAAAS